MKRTIATVLFCIIVALMPQVVYSGESMKIEKPFYKVNIDSQGIRYKVVLNGVDVKIDKDLHPVQVEIPVNQFVRTGENNFELQVYPLSKAGNRYKNESDKIAVEFRLYTSVSDFVVLSELSYSASEDKKGTPFSGSTAGGTYHIEDHKLIADNKGDYKVSELGVQVDANRYNFTYLRQSLTMTTPFPEWGFLSGDLLPDLTTFKNLEEMGDAVVYKPFAILEEIHASLAKKDVKSILPYFEERNKEMDLAFYYEAGTYQNLLADAFQDDIDNSLILKGINLKKAQPVISSGRNLLQLGTVPLIVFYDKEKTVFMKYDIFFRKDGDNWIISR